MLPHYGRILHIPAFNPAEKNIDRGRKVMELDGGSKLSRPNPQRIALGPSPSAPFDDYRQAQSEKLLSQMPLKGLHLAAPRFIPKIERKSVHPFVRAEANCAQPGLKLPGVCGFA